MNCIPCLNNDEMIESIPTKPDSKQNLLLQSPQQSPNIMEIKKSNSMAAKPKKRYNYTELQFSKLTGEHVKQGFEDLLPFTIEDCHVFGINQDSSLFILNAIAQCTVDECRDSFIFIGPSEGPVFIRDCKNCVFVVACHQLRLRDCQNLHINLFCKGQPSIETSTGIVLSSFCYHYDGLEGIGC